MVTIQNAQIKAEISACGAELVLLQDTRGRDFLWDGDPVWWRGRAPLLFPIVGRVRDDQILVDGVRYPMRQHGLARTSEFALMGATDKDCRFCLESSARTRDQFPFEFRLEVGYALSGSSLLIDAVIRNPGSRSMPVSFGFHPAFRWPLPDGGEKEAHVLVFDEIEPAPIRRIKDGLLTDRRFDTPIVDRVLRLQDRLFDEDVVILDRIKSRGVRFASPSGPAIRVAFPAMPHLGVWSKPGAGFLCIEPWQGYAAPMGFAGELATKEGMIEVAALSSATFSMSVTILP